MKNKFLNLLFFTFILLACGCATVVRHAVPLDLVNNTRVYGMQNIRVFGGIPSDSFKEDFIKLLEQEEKTGFSLFDFQSRRTYSILAISGGGANGAYGAGILNGWSRAGTRPEFKIVTGISTGAIIAPFALLGSKHDDTLKELYTKRSTRDIARIHPSGHSLASAQPLERLIEQYFDAALLKEIAVEYNKGRRLYVGTTNLDAQRLVIWDMGKIAAIGDDKALTLFRKIILASSSIPIAFPPVYFNVEVDGTTYNEMHVDGGIVKQVFFLYDVLRGFDKATKEKGLDISKVHYTIYIIRNGYAEPVWKEIPNKLSAIAARAVDTMVNAQSVGDIYELYTFTKLGRGDFNLAYIPVTYASKAKELFDSVEMQALFDLGFKEASEGYPWRKLPPGLEGAEKEGK